MKIAPSILSANFNHLYDDVKDLKKLGCDYLHVDVMDGHFVPNISFGTLAYENLKGKLDMIFDVHLMITNPLYYAPIFIKKGADILTFHLEVEQDKDEIIKVIKENGAKAGISIKPKTNVEELVPYLDKIDLVLVMSVEPGFGGQKFMENSLPKIKFFRGIRTKSYLFSLTIFLNFAKSQGVALSSASITKIQSPFAFSKAKLRAGSTYPRSYPRQR